MKQTARPESRRPGIRRLGASLLSLLLLPVLLVGIACTGEPRSAAGDQATTDVPSEHPSEEVGTPAEAEAPAGLTEDEVAAQDPAAQDPAAAGAAEDPTTAQTVSPAEDELSLRERELALKERELRLREREVAAREERAADSEPAAAAVPPAADEAPTPAEPEPLTAEADTSLPADTDLAAAPEPSPEPERPVRTVPVTVPAGTVLEVEIVDALSSETSMPGDRFEGRVVQDVFAEGALAIPAGSRILGTVTEAQPLKEIGGQARLALSFNRLVLPGGQEVGITTSFAEAGRSETKKDAATIGGSAAAGALLGRILGGKGDRKKGTVIGAIVGAAVGTAVASRTPGEPVEIPAGTVVNLSLDEWLRVLVTE